MPTSSRPSGVRITTSEAITVDADTTEAPGGRRRRSGRLFGPTPLPGAPSDSSAGRADLLAALAAQEMTIVDEVDLEPQPTAATATRGTTPRSASATLELDVASDEEAVVLLEQDGLYSWHFPSHTEASGPKVSRGRRGIAPSGRTARFTLEFQSVPGAVGGPQQRGLVKDFLMARARAVVLKFAAEADGGSGAAALRAQRAARVGRDGWR